MRSLVAAAFGGVVVGLLADRLHWRIKINRALSDENLVAVLDHWTDDDEEEEDEWPL